MYDIVLGMKSSNKIQYNILSSFIIYIVKSCMQEYL